MRVCICGGTRVKSGGGGRELNCRVRVVAEACFLGGRVFAESASGNVGAPTAQSVRADGRQTLACGEVPRMRGRARERRRSLKYRVKGREEWRRRWQMAMKMEEPAAGVKVEGDGWMQVPEALADCSSSSSWSSSSSSSSCSGQCGRGLRGTRGAPGVEWCLAQADTQPE